MKKIPNSTLDREKRKQLTPNSLYTSGGGSDSLKDESSISSVAASLRKIQSKPQTMTRQVTECISFDPEFWIPPSFRWISSSTIDNR